MTENYRDWVPLRDHVDKLFQAVDRDIENIRREMQREHDANQTALVRADQITDYKFAGVNEWRNTVETIVKSSVTTGQLASIEDLRRAELQGVRSQIDTLTRLVYIGVGGIIVLQIVLQYLTF